MDAPITQKRRRLTKKQRGFVNNYADTGNGTQSVIKAGYNVSSKESAAVIATEVLSSINVQEELRKLGFDSNNAKRVISEILNDETNEPKDRLKAAENIFKVHGDYAPDKSITVNVEVEASDEIREAAQKLNEIYGRSSISSDGVVSSTLGNETQD